MSQEVKVPPSIATGIVSEEVKPAFQLPGLSRQSSLDLGGGRDNLGADRVKTMFY